ncbi:MAG: hypothetical protein ACREEM_46470 [Blastocatellia bacterium]
MANNKSLEQVANALGHAMADFCEHDQTPTEMANRLYQAFLNWHDQYTGVRDMMRRDFGAIVTAPASGEPQPIRETALRFAHAAEAFIRHPEALKDIVADLRELLGDGDFVGRCEAASKAEIETAMKQAA